MNNYFVIQTVFQDHVKSLEINEENEKYKQELEQLMEEWTTLSEE